MVNFLAHLHSERYKYNSINTYHSAISSVHERVDGYSVGQHPMVTRLLKRIFNDRPPLPRYSHTWNVQIVLDYLISLGNNYDLSLKQLTWKTAMLLALTRLSRSADLSHLDIVWKQYKPDGAMFLSSALAKSPCQGKEIPGFFFPSFPDNIYLCSVRTLKDYEK